jgi:bloom syndrome protein
MDKSQASLSNLYSIVKYCEDSLTCRRKILSSYFNEDFDTALCNQSCDNCAYPSEVDKVDITDAAKDLLNIIEEVSQNDSRVTFLQVYRM